MSEATTIDTLSIEITSNATGAAQGISNLADSLAKLKTNGTISVAIKNLDKLSTALRSFQGVSSGSQKLSALAVSLERLQGLKSVAPLANSITKLGTAMNAVRGLNMDGVDTKFEAIANAASKLSGVKAGGLGTMVNALAKLGKVTDSLDDDTINKFADRVAKLNEKLEPLSTKMTTIQSGLRGVNSSARSASGGVKKLGDEVNTTALNFANFAMIAQSVMPILQRVAEILGRAIAQAIEWDGIAARFGRGFGDQAQDVYDWIQRLNKEMGINVQQFMQYSSVYATMLTGFGVSMEDAGKMALGYTELTYDIWAGYNDVYKNYDDAAEAVKSAIAGEVEPIRRAGFTIVESTLEQTAANHGLTISLEKATEAEKSYLRYLTLVDQARSQGLVGTYAAELNTAEGMMRTFSQQLKSLAQALGSLFLPILTKVVPWLQAFVELLTEAIAVIAGFFGIEIQPVDFSSWSSGSSSMDNLGASADAATDAVGGTAKAIKDLERATLGIDELNVISPPSPSGGGGGAGGGSGNDFGDLDIDSLWDESIFDQIQSKVDELKSTITDILPVLGGVAAAFAGWRLMHLLDDIDDVDAKLPKLSKTIKGLGKGLAIAGISVAVGAIIWDLTGAYLQGGNEADLLKALGTTALGTALAYFLAGKAGAGIVLVTSGVVTLTRLVVEISNGTVEWDDPESVATAFVGLVETAIGTALTWKVIGPVVKKAFAGLGTKISGWLGGGGLSALLGKISPTLIKALGSAGPWAALAAAIAAYIGLAIVDYDFTDVGRKVGKAVGEAIKWAFSNLTPIGLGLKLYNWIKEELDVESLAELVATLFKWETWRDVIIPKIEEIFTGIGDFFSEKFDNLAENIGELQTGFIEGIEEAFDIDLSFLDFFVMEDSSELGQILNPTRLFMNFGENVIEALGGEEIIEWAEDTVEGIKEAFAGLLGDPIETVTDFVDDVIEFFTDLWDTLVGHSIVPDTIDGIVECFEELPGRVLGLVGDFVQDIVDEFSDFGKDVTEKVKSGWETVKNWWNKKSDLKTYTPKIGSIKTKLSEAWSTAKKWWTDSKGTLATYTPSIGNIREKLSTAWSTAKDWWNKSKGVLSYTPTIGSIKSKLSAAWSTAKDWWNKTKGDLSYTPIIGSIKDGLSSAWKEAKKWWNDNVKLSIPSLDFEVTYTKKGLNQVQKAVVKALGLEGWPKLSFAANGGIFDTGSLIWAGERGAEVVANAGGGKTGVMNIDQMQEAVSNGVYSAVMAAMSRSGGSGSQPVNVYLDGKQIYSSVKRRESERGKTLMGNQLGYNY